MRSDAAWHAAHSGTARLIVAAGVVPFVAGVALLVLQSADDATIATAVMRSLGMTLALVLTAGFRGHRIARRVNELGVEDDSHDAR